MPITPASPEFPFPQLPMSIDKIQALTKSLEDVGISYGLGAKIEPVSLQASDLDGAGISSVDCSGFVRWIVWHANGILLPDGSANQHEWFNGYKGFKPSTYENARDSKDAHIRIGFLTPEDGGGVGHVLLAINSKTYESHGGKGPDSRDVSDAHGFMALMHWYVVCL